MRGSSINLDGLLQLQALSDPAARRASFREALTDLAHAITLDGPSPLEGALPQALEGAVEIARKDGWLEQLDWLGTDLLGPALYELAAALPAGTEKRELGRRVYGLLHEGSAPTFAAIATRMALGSRKGLTGHALRARVALVFALPARVLEAGPLAYALTARRELAREWIAGPSISSLPARRLSGRILERAAVVAVRRSVRGDDFAPRVFASDVIAVPFARLLADREPLVWRHAATARGLLAGVSEAHWCAVRDGLHPGLTPTEWRRAMVSLAAALGVVPDRAAPLLREVLEGPLPVRDPGLPASVIWGLTHAFETEPELAEATLRTAIASGASGVIEAACGLVRELTLLGDRVGPTSGESFDKVRQELARRTKELPDSAGRELAQAMLVDLSEPSDRRKTVRESVAHALSAFAVQSASAAHAEAIFALERARAAVDRAEGTDRDERLPLRLSSLTAGRPRRVRVPSEEGALEDLYDLDVGLLEDATLGYLLALGDARSGLPYQLVSLRDRLGRLLIEQEERHVPASPDRPSREPPPSGPTGSSRRLIALLHLVDQDSQAVDEVDDPARTESLQRATAGLLFERLSQEDGSSPLHRAATATLARALDALVRGGACEPVDVLLISADLLPRLADVATLGEATMIPDVETALLSWARFATAEAEDNAQEPDAHNALLGRATALAELAASLGDDGTGRADALRSVLSRLSRTLIHLFSASSRASLLDPRTSPDQELARLVHSYGQLVAGARLRVLGEGALGGGSSSALNATAALSRTLGRLTVTAVDDARAVVDEAMGEIRGLLPPPLGRLVHDVLLAVVELPASIRGPALATPRAHRAGAPLPAWLGPRRALGGFWIVRPLGAGAASSVFVAKRFEERNDPEAEQFALKVPEYDGAAARALTEREFLDFFRAEASALLGLPPDPNLARFVTFDLAARPKPILVMELIAGPTLDRFLAAELANVTDPGPNAHDPMRLGAALAILDGVAAGLETMHRHGIGHLDIKPSNVILRDGKIPTLVDFGLAGRHIRPGCATGPYGAPEVWGLALEDQPTRSPLAADVYAFGATIFEVLTGQVLFEADSEVGIVTKHLMHDGHPDRLDRLKNIRPLVDLLEHMLRRDPTKRWSISDVRRALAIIRQHVEDFPWPVS